MLAAISFCFLLGVATIASSQSPPQDYDSPFTEPVPTSERRTLGHIKPIKRIPVIKKHKKFGSWVPVYKTEFAALPIQEAPSPPSYKFHRYHGINLKPVEGSTSTLSLAPFEFYAGNYPYFPPQITYFSSSPPKHAFHGLSSPPKDGPIIEQISSPLPIKTEITSVPSIPPPIFVPSFPPSPPVTFFKTPEPFQKVEPLFPSLPIPPPHPLPVASFPSPLVLPPVKFSPPLISPTPSPFLQPPFALPQISTPVPILESFPVKESFPVPNFEFPTPTSSIDVAPPSISLPSPTTEPEFPYPPSGTPIPSHINDISLADPHPEVPQSTPELSIIEKDTTKLAAPVTSKPDAGIFNKVKGWKTQKAQAALNHLNKFNKFQHFSAASQPTVSDKTPPANLGASLPNSHLPFLPSLAFHVPTSLPDLKPTQGYFSFPHQNPLPPIKYEHFPPNNELAPPLFNSYGVPIPHDSYAPPKFQISHDRVSAATEEKVSVLPAPPNFTEEIPKHSAINQGTEEPQTSPSQLELQTKNFRQFNRPSSDVIFNERPVYVSDNKEISEEGNKQIEEVSQLQQNTNLESNSAKKEEDLGSISNHREE